MGERSGKVGANPKAVGGKDELLCSILAFTSTKGGIVSQLIKRSQSLCAPIEGNILAFAPRLSCSPCTAAAPDFVRRPPQSSKRRLAEQLVTAFNGHCLEGGACGCRLEFSTLYGWFEEWLEYEEIGACISKNLFARALTSIGIAPETEWFGPPNKRVKKTFRRIRPIPLTLAA